METNMLCIWIMTRGQVGRMQYIAQRKSNARWFPGFIAIGLVKLSRKRPRSTPARTTLVVRSTLVRLAVH